MPTDVGGRLEDLQRIEHFTSQAMEPDERRPIDVAAEGHPMCGETHRVGDNEWGFQLAMQSANEIARLWHTRSARPIARTVKHAEIDQQTLDHRRLVFATGRIQAGIAVRYSQVISNGSRQ